MQPKDLERLVTIEMPYGKYIGRVIADLPGDYLSWFARQGFPPGEIGRLLALMHEIELNGRIGTSSARRQVSAGAAPSSIAHWQRRAPENTAQAPRTGAP